MKQLLISLLIINSYPPINVGHWLWDNFISGISIIIGIASRPLNFACEALQKK